MKLPIFLFLIPAFWGCTQVYTVGQDQYECNIFDKSCINEIEEIKKQRIENHRRLRQLEKLRQEQKEREEQEENARCQREYEESEARRKQWEKDYVKCNNYLKYISGSGWFAAGYSNRLYDRCKYQGRSDCLTRAHNSSECVKRECMFAPVYYSEYKHPGNAYITKEQYKKCFDGR